MTDCANVPIDLLSMLLNEKEVTPSHMDAEDASALLRALEQEARGAEFIMYAQALEQDTTGAGFAYVQDMSLLSDINDISDIPDLDFLESDDDSLNLFEQDLQQLANGSPAVPVAGYKRKLDDSDIFTDFMPLEIFNPMTVATPQFEDLGAPFAKRPFVDDSELSLSFLEDPFRDMDDMKMEDFEYEGDTILV